MSRRHAARRSAGMDTAVTVGSVHLANPVMTASGTGGHGAELAEYFDLSMLGAVVVKSLAAFAWPGNPAPRVHPTPYGMLNAVGLQGPGVEAWLAHDLPLLVGAGATVVASIWGRTLDEFAAAGQALAAASERVVAVEVNLSCPNLAHSGGGRPAIFAHDPDLSAAVISDVVRMAGRPCWAKLSPNTDRIVEVAGAVHAAGADAVTLVNTVLGLALDPGSGRVALGAGGGGLSGRAIHPVAVRAVWDVHAAHPRLPVVGVGGVGSGWDAAELMLAGASAVQVGTATFADPRAPLSVLDELRSWAQAHRYATLRALTGAGEPR